MAKRRKTNPKQTKAIKASRYTRQTVSPAITPAWELVKDTYEYTEKRTLHKTILVVCQEQAETYYFKHFPLTSLVVVGLSGEQRTPLQTVLYAQEVAKEMHYDFDEVWCVCDAAPSEANNLEAAAKKANALGYKFVYSNDSFDLWVWLHYGDPQEDYASALNETLQIDPEEGKKADFYKLLYNRLEEDERAIRAKAIARAKKLYSLQEKRAYADQDPLTNIYQLVEAMTSD